MEIGDKVRIVKIPEHLPVDNLNTQELFKLCLGRAFPIIGFNEVGMLELEVGQVLGKPAYEDSIWIEPEFVEIVANITDSREHRKDNAL